MSGRIRTIKPDFFKHESLYDAEAETGLPLRVAFAGLWTVCDREGRFEWRPRKLKLEVLPYDDLDFSRVLDALTTRGFVVRYKVGTREYGVVPSFLSHQVINNREKESSLPPPPQVPDLHEKTTRERRVDDACLTPLVHAQAEGEGEGEDIREDTDVSSLSPDGDDPDFDPATPKLFDGIAEAVSAYNRAADAAGWPKVQVLSKARRTALSARLKSSGGLDGWNAALAKARASPHCCGQNERGWTANFDFLTRESSFIKLMEGQYDQRTGKGTNQPPKGRENRPDPALANIARLAGLGRASSDGGS